MVFPLGRKKPDAKGEFMKKFMRKFLKVLFSMLLLTAGLTACGRAAEEEKLPPTPTPIPEPTGILRPVAEFQTVNYDLSLLTDYVWAGDSLIYREYGYDKLNAERQNSYLRVALDGSGEPELLVQEGDGLEVFCICADRYDALYLFGREKQEESSRFFLEKQSPSGEVLYRSWLEEEVPDDNLLYELYADGEGNLALVNSWLELFFLFDDTGTYLGKGSLPFTPTGLVDGGADGTWLWTADWGTGMTAARVDFEQGVVGEKETIAFPSSLKAGLAETGTPLSGCELGLLVSTGSTLWQYSPDSGQATELLSWNDENLNIDGTKIAELRVGEKQSGGLYQMRLFIGYSYSSQEVETAEITYVDQAYLPERRTITLGTTFRYGVEGSVRRFNRSNREYYVEIREYGSLEEPVENPLEAMIFDPEGIPDILEVSSLQKEVLESKGLLEDLDSYLKESDSLQAEELLETVLQADTANGSLTALTTRFSIDTLGVSTEGVDETGWSVDMFLNLAEQEQEAFLQYNYSFNMFRCIMEANLNRFINWEKGTCSFESDGFLDWIEHMRQISYAQSGTLPHYDTVEEELSAFLRGNGQVKFEYFSNLEDYQNKRLKYRNKAVFAGYPTADGSPCHILAPTEQYSIYSGSECREGAWAFIEFLLSEEEQKRYAYEQSGFPVRKDALDYAMEQPFKYAEGSLSEEDRAAFEEMLNTLTAPQYTISALRAIIWEELEPFFAGDKSAEEAVSILQNRVQLYLDEM